MSDALKLTSHAERNRQSQQLWGFEPKGSELKFWIRMPISTAYSTLLYVCTPWQDEIGWLRSRLGKLYG
jgi:hypothetical protein